MQNLATGIIQHNQHAPAPPSALKPKSRGRFTPSDEMKDLAMQMAAHGIAQRKIAQSLGIGLSTLRRRFRPQLVAGAARWDLSRSWPPFKFVLVDGAAAVVFQPAKTTPHALFP